MKETVASAPAVDRVDTGNDPRVAAARLLGATKSSPIDDAIMERMGHLEEVYRDIHAHPELGLHETRTAKIVADEMRSMGFEVTEGVGGTGIVSVLKNGDGPTIMVRADMDALPIQEETGLPYASQTPGVMHACGHDLHVAVELGTAYALVKNRDQWKGTLVMITQPAEEIGAGAKAMIKDGLFERFPKPSAIIAFHTSGLHAAGTIEYTPGPAYAADDVFDVVFHGQGGHGSIPNVTVDPVDMMAEFVQKMHTLIADEVDPQEVAVLTIGLAQAGTAANIIPNTAHVQGTIRTYSPAVREFLKQRLADTAKAISTGARGGPPDVSFLASIDAVNNDEALIARMTPALQGAAIDGKITQIRGITGSEDFSEYAGAAHAPEFMFWVGVQASLTPPVYANHTSRFAPDFRPSFTTAARAMTQSVLTLMPVTAKT